MHTRALLLDFLWRLAAMAGLLVGYLPMLTWVKHVSSLVGTCGYGGGGVVEHGVVLKHASEFVQFLGNTDFGSIKANLPPFHKCQPCVLSDFILDIATRRSHVPCFQIRLPILEYDHLTKVLDKEIGSQVNKARKLWLAPLHAVQFNGLRPRKEM